MTDNHRHGRMNESQRNSLTVTLRILEERIVSLQRLMRERRLQGVLFSFSHDWSEDDLQRLEQSFARILNLIGEAKERFGLGEKTTRFDSLLHAFAAHFWALLTDEKASKLSRFGPVDPLLAEDLDPLIDRLLDEIKSLDRLER